MLVLLGKRVIPRLAVESMASLEIMQTKTEATTSLWIGIEFSREGHLISFTQEVSVTNKDLTKLIRLNSNYRVSTLFNYLLNWCFLINFLIKMY